MTETAVVNPGVKVTRNRFDVRAARVFAGMAFDLYEAGEIDLDELRRQLARLPDCIGAREKVDTETPA